MTILIFLCLVAMFDLAIAFTIRHECIHYPGMAQTATTDRLIDVAIIMSIVAAIVGISHLSGVM